MGGRAAKVAKAARSLGRPGAAGLGCFSFNLKVMAFSFLKTKRGCAFLCSGLC